MPEDKDAPIHLGGTEDHEPLSLADEEDANGLASSRSSTKIHTFGAHAAGVRMEQRKFKRPPNLTGAGAIRCRLFHSKITVAALEHMVNQINEWLDDNEIEAKYIGQVVGTMEGKSPEPNVIITVWY